LRHALIPPEKLLTLSIPCAFNTLAPMADLDPDAQ
jgi:hypothetical protein